MLPASGSRVMSDVPASDVNLFYYSSSTTRRSKVPTYQTTNAEYSLNVASSGSTATVIIPKNAGLSHVVLGLTLPNQNYLGLGLNQGWCFDLIKEITYRYGGSSQWSMSSDALRVAALVNAGSKSESQALMELAGAPIYVDAMDATSGLLKNPNNLTGMIPLTLAHCSSESGSETKLPLDTSLMDGNLVITITFANFSEVFAKNGGTGVIPTQLDAGWVQTRQVIPLFRDDMKKLTDSQAYNYPISWFQPPTAVKLNSPSADSINTINLVGFKQGECRGFYAWIVKSQGAEAEVNKLDKSLYIPVADCTASYAGTVLQRFKGRNSAPFMDTLYQDCPSYFQMPDLYAATGSGAVGYEIRAASPFAQSSFIHCPFAQRWEQGTGGSEYMLMNGVGINNGNITLEFKLSDPAFDATATYTLYYMPYFVAALSFSGYGNVDYIF